MLLLALALAGPSRAQWQDRPPITDLLQRAGAAGSRAAPDLTGLDTSPSRDRQLPFFREIMATPLDAPCRAGVLADDLRTRRNTSMGQGAGYGIRGDFEDGRSVAGGIGVLVDLGGDDRYEAQVFAQGVGYYEGLGVLVDDGGGLFLDLGGDDRYPAHCARAGHNRMWAAPRKWPELNLRSESGAGADGEWPMPFPLRLLTKP